MGRSGYSEDYDDDGAGWLYRGAVASAICGRRGQAFLKEMLAALDALPEKKLIAGDLVRDGAACAIGAVALKRGVDVSNLDPEDAEAIAKTFGIAPAMAREIEFENDDDFSYVGKETDEQRFERVRKWIVSQIRDEN